jgi:hypothetical protein
MRAGTSVSRHRSAINDGCARGQGYGYRGSGGGGGQDESPALMGGGHDVLPCVWAALAAALIGKSDDDASV